MVERRSDALLFFSPRVSRRLRPVNIGGFCRPSRPLGRILGGPGGRPRLNMTPEVVRVAGCPPLVLLIYGKSYNCDY